MTTLQMLITVLVCALATMLMRFLPFIIFRDGRKTPPYVRYLGAALPGAVFSMLVVYCLKDVDVLHGSHGLPELIAIAIVALLHIWKGKILLSIAGGTIAYMLLVQLVF